MADEITQLSASDTPEIPKVDIAGQNEYLTYSSLYTAILTGEKVDFIPEELPARKSGWTAPETFMNSAKTFAQNVVSLIPSEVFEDSELRPFNRCQLRALVAATYNLLDDPPGPESDDMYTRVLTLLSSDVLQSKNRSGTEHLTETFLGAAFSRQNLYNYLVRFVEETSPVYERKSELRAHEESYNKFLSLLQVALKPSVEEYLRCVQQYCPDTFDDLKITNPVFVSSLPALSIFTNDSYTSEAYPPGLTSFAGTTSHVDEITGLPLVLYTVPENILMARNLDIHNLNGNPVFNRVLAYIHETVHNTAGSVDETVNDSTDLTFVEALTDAASKIMIMRTLGAGTVEDRAKFKIEAGYYTLVDFLETLLKDGLITEADIISGALRQDPEILYTKIEASIKEKGRAGATLLYNNLSSHIFVLPVKLEERATQVDQVFADPIGYMRKEMLRARSYMTSDYLDSNAIKDSVVEEIFREDGGKTTRFRCQKIAFDDKGLLTERGVEIFYSKLKFGYPEDEGGFHVPFLLESQVSMLSLKPETMAMIGSALPEKYSMAEDPEGTNEILDAVEVVLANGLQDLESFPRDSRAATLVGAAQEIYSTVANIFERNLVQKGKEVSKKQVVDFISAVIPWWFVENGLRAENVEGLVDNIRTVLESVTSEVDGNVPGIETVKYWARGVDLSSGIAEGALY